MVGHGLGVWLRWAAALSVAVIGRADVLQLDNGEVLHGRLERVDGQTVRFVSEHCGVVDLPREGVVSLETDEPVVVSLADGRRRVVSLLPGSEPGALTWMDGGRLQVVTWEQIAAIGRSPADVPEATVASDATEEPGQAPWTGSINAALTAMRGNTDMRRTSGAIQLSRRTEHTKTSLSSDYARAAQRDRAGGSEAVSEDWWKTTGKLNYYFTEKNYTYVDGRYERDRVANLVRRIAVGVGAGYQLVESEELTVSMDVGGASLREEYHPTGTDKQELSLQLGYDFDLKVNDHLSVRHDLTCYPDGRKPSDYYLTSTAEVKRSFGQRLFANVKAVFDYDAVPAAGKLRSDLKTIFGVGLNF